MTSLHFTVGKKLHDSGHSFIFDLLDYFNPLSVSSTSSKYPAFRRTAASDSVAVGDQPVQTHCAQHLARLGFFPNLLADTLIETVQCSAQRWPENNASVCCCLTQAIRNYFLGHPVVHIPAPEIRENMLHNHKHNQLEFEYNSECTDRT